MEGGESTRESFLRRIHDRHQPQLAPDHGGHGQAGLERPARQDVVPHVPDVPVHVQAYAHGGRHVYGDDQPVQGTEIRVKRRHGSVGDWLVYPKGPRSKRDRVRNAASGLSAFFRAGFTSAGVLALLPGFTWTRVRALLADMIDQFGGQADIIRGGQREQTQLVVVRQVRLRIRSSMISCVMAVPGSAP